MIKEDKSFISKIMKHIFDESSKKKGFKRLEIQNLMSLKETKERKKGKCSFILECCSFNLPQRFH